MCGEQKKIGITGGIAAGKSTIASMFRQLGGEVVDADQLSRQVTTPGSPVLTQICAEFGPQILDQDLRLNRAKLGEIIFGDAKARKRLEAIIHPAIFALAEERFEELAGQGHGIVFYEAPLLIETERHNSVDRLVVVRADDAIRIRRLMARSNLDQAQAERRLAAQISQAEKEALADYVIDNSDSLEQTRAQVESVWKQLQTLNWQETE